MLSRLLILKHMCHTNYPLPLPQSVITFPPITTWSNQSGSICNSCNVPNCVAKELTSVFLHQSWHWPKQWCLLQPPVFQESHSLFLFATVLWGNWQDLNHEICVVREWKSLLWQVMTRPKPSNICCKGMEKSAMTSPNLNHDIHVVRELTILPWQDQNHDIHIVTCKGIKKSAMTRPKPM